jgi:hypothetical protein
MCKGKCVKGSSKQTRKERENRQKKKTKQDRTHAKWGARGREDASGPVVPRRAIFNTRSSELTDEQIVKHIDMMEAESRSRIV